MKRPRTPRAPRRKPAAPDGLAATELRVGDERLLVLSFPIHGGEGASPVVALTEAESEVLLRVLEGACNGEIAAQRGTSSRTVANQLASIYRKLGVCGRGELLSRFGGR